MDESSSKKVWIWRQANGEPFQVISDAKQGYIKVYNGKKELVLDKKNLSEDQVRIIEQHFLDVIVNQKTYSKPRNNQSFDPMVA